jgi:hypothetical protein
MTHKTKQQSVSMLKALVVAFSCLVVLLLAGPLTSDQGDLNTELMWATVKPVVEPPMRLICQS